MGYLTHDVTLKNIGSAVLAEFGVASTHKYKTAGGEQREETLFIDCSAWGKLGETIHRFFAKGKPIFVEGRLKFSRWEDKTTGAKRNKITLVVESFQFLESGKGGGDRQPPRKASHAQDPAVRAFAGFSGGAADFEPDFPVEEIDPDSIPF